MCGASHLRGEVGCRAGGQPVPIGMSGRSWPADATDRRGRADSAFALWLGLHRQMAMLILNGQLVSATDAPMPAC